MKSKIYLAIDLKSFYASCECASRGLDPLTTNLVVADASRNRKDNMFGCIAFFKAVWNWWKVSFV